MPDFDIPEILTLITVSMFSIFSADWSAKVYAGEVFFEDKSQFN